MIQKEISIIDPLTEEITLSGKYFYLGCDAILKKKKQDALGNETETNTISHIQLLDLQSKRHLLK